jgi:hypothetical protein
LAMVFIALAIAFLAILRRLKGCKSYRAEGRS